MARTVKLDVKRTKPKEQYVVFDLDVCRMVLTEVTRTETERAAQGIAKDRGITKKMGPSITCGFMEVERWEELTR